MAASIKIVRRHWLLMMGVLVAAVAVPISYVVAAASSGPVAIEQFPQPLPLPAPECGEPSPPVTDCDIIVNKELMITEKCVVNDPVRTRWDANGAEPTALGAWTFGKLIASIGGFPDIDSDPVGLSNFVRDWLANWQVDQFNNNGGGECIAELRNIDSMISLWEQVSEVPPGGVLNMRLAPFRLLAVVNRIDLRKNPVYGNGNAGEARFVFGVLQINPNNPDPDNWGGQRFTVILEYIQPAARCKDVLNLADRWHLLGSIEFGDDYNKALQEITDGFAGFGVAPNRPNGSSISQVRSNEIAIGDPWELREFRLVGDVDPSPLIQHTVAQTPDLRHNEFQILANYLAANEPEILAEQHVVPLEFEGECFAGISSKNPLPVWDAPGFTCTETRFKFAFNTCSGCHGPETATFDFLHVHPRDHNSEAALSAFLEGVVGVQDPTCGGGIERDFNDLERRAFDLCQLLNATCTPIIGVEEAEMAEMAAAAQSADPAVQAEAMLAAPNNEIFDNAPFAAHNRVH